MKPYLVIFPFILSSLLFVSCSKHNGSRSIKIKGEKVYFTLIDNNYKNVLFGNDILGEWKNMPMKKIDSVWVISFQNPHKTVEYKFFINYNRWLRDPLNPEKIKVPPPYGGFNSVIEFN